MSTHMAVVVKSVLGYHFEGLANAPPILEPVLVVGLNQMFTGGTTGILTQTQMSVFGRSPIRPRGATHMEPTKSRKKGWGSLGKVFGDFDPDPNWVGFPSSLIFQSKCLLFKGLTSHPRKRAGIDPFVGLCCFARKESPRD